MIAHHPKPYKSYPELEEHIKEIKDIDAIAGLSHHDEIFKLPVGAELEEEECNEEMRMEEDAKIKAALEEKLKRVREEKARERLLTQQDGGSPVLTTRKRRKLAARKNGWNHETFNQFAGTPPEKKKRKLKEKPETPDTPMVDGENEERPFNPDPTPVKEPENIASPSESLKRKLTEESIGSNKKRKLGTKTNSFGDGLQDEPMNETAE